MEDNIDTNPSYFQRNLGWRIAGTIGLVFLSTFLAVQHDPISAIIVASAIIACWLDGHNPRHQIPRLTLLAIVAGYCVAMRFLIPPLVDGWWMFPTLFVVIFIIAFVHILFPKRFHRT